MTHTDKALWQVFAEGNIEFGSEYNARHSTFDKDFQAVTRDAKNGIPKAQDLLTRYQIWAVTQRLKA